MSKVTIFDGQIIGFERIRSQECECTIAPNGSAALNLKWDQFIGTRMDLFVFDRDVVSLEEFSVEESAIQILELKKTKYFLTGATLGGGVMGGILGALAGGAAGSVVANNTTKTDELLAARVTYQSPKRRTGYFTMVAKADVMKFMISSIPEAKLIRGS